MPTDLTVRVREELVKSGAAATPETIAAALATVGVLVGTSGEATLVAKVMSELIGAGPLQFLLAQPGVTDVMVNGPKEVWIERNGQLERTDVTFKSEREIRRLAQRLAGQAGRRLDHAAPFVDAPLPGGIRLHAVLAGVAHPGTLISLRVFGRRMMSLGDLAGQHAFPAAGLPILQRLMNQSVSFLVTGGTGTGKTTLLRALLADAPAEHRILVLEEHLELAVDHPHVVSMQARPANTEGVGSITMSQLVRQAMRMRPDRIVVGEARGPEVVELLAAMNTGHEGCAATLHANSASDVSARLEALALPAGLGREALHAQLLAGVGAILHLRRDRPTGQRRLSGISAIDRGPTGLAVISQVWDFQVPRPRLLQPRHHLAALLASSP